MNFGNSSETKKYKRIRYNGVQTNRAKVMVNDGKHPLEVLFGAPYNYATNGLRVTSYDEVNTYDIYSLGSPFNSVSLTGAEADTAQLRTLQGLISSDSIVGWTSNSGNNIPKTARVVLMPGESLEENGTAFDTNRYVTLFYREMTNIEVEV